MPMRSSISWRMAVDQGSAPNTPTRNGKARMSTFSSAARSAIVKA